MSWVSRRVHRSMRIERNHGWAAVQADADERHERLKARLDRRIAIYVRRLHHPPLLHNGKKPR